ncbi:MAG TPA: TIGR02594 family protein [Sphingomicrobium sp.]
MAGSREGQAALTDFLRTGGQNIDPATRAWCADFVNATLTKAGQKGTDSGMARSFLQWGQGVTQPERGDVAVFSRGGPNAPTGHVGFFDSINPDGSIRVLGGNQSDSVSYANYPADRLLGYRRAAPPNPNERLGGDSMVARNTAPQVAGQMNTSLGGLGGDNTLLAGSGGLLAHQRPINPELAALAGDEEKSTAAKIGGLLSNLGQAFPDAPQPNLGPMPDATKYGGILSKFLDSMTRRV